MGKQHTARGRRIRRRRRRGRMHPAIATEISTRARGDWPVTRRITRYHPYDGSLGYED